MQDAGGCQSQLIPIGCVILFVFVVRSTRGAEAEQQECDGREENQQDDKLQKINNLHFEPLNR